MHICKVFAVESGMCVCVPFLQFVAGRQANFFSATPKIIMENLLSDKLWPLKASIT